MPISVRRSPTKLDDDAGVSEVIGFVLVFGILSMMLVLSMVAFNGLHGRAKTSVVTLEAQSVAQRVAASAVDAALFAERHDSNLSRYQHLLDLPSYLEREQYRVYLDAGPVQQVRVLVPGMAINVTAPLFSAGASGTVGLCPGSVAGGALRVAFGPNPADPTKRCIFLEL